MTPLQPEQNITLPFKLTDTEYSIYIGLQQDSWDRMKVYDPAEIPTRQLGEPWVSMKLRDVIIGFVNDDDIKKVQQMANAGESVREVLKFLTRGFAYKPEAGDHDSPYKSLIFGINASAKKQ